MSANELMSKTCLGRSSSDAASEGKGGFAKGGCGGPVRPAGKERMALGERPDAEMVDEALSKVMGI